jgi:hypothetical protein
MADTQVDETDEPMSMKAKSIATVVALVVLVAAGYGLMRISSPAIGSGEASPPGHYTFACEICHVVTVAPTGGATP